MGRIVLFLFLSAFTSVAFSQTSVLSVEKIMRDPKWMGTSPDGIFWNANSSQVYFNWNPEAEATSSLFKISPKNLTPQKVGTEEQREILRSGVYDKAKRRMVFTKNGDIFIQDVRSGRTTQLTQTSANEINVRFGPGEKSIVFQQGDNFFTLSLEKQELIQLTNFQRGEGGSGRSAERESRLSTQDKWLQEDQMELFDVLKEGKRQDSIRQAQREASRGEPAIPAIQVKDGILNSVEISPDLRFVSYRITSPASGNKGTVVPNYVTESGYTENISTRTKVGNTLSTSKSFIYDRERDTVLEIDQSTIPGIKDLPDFWNDYPEKKEALLAKNEDRNVTLGSPIWNETGSAAFLVATAADNKDRWLLKLNAEDASLSLIDRQRDEAWIGGPGISGFRGGNVGWIDEEHIYFQSEATGYSHLYTANIHSGEKKQLTDGNWEVRSLELSADKKHFYITANKDHPGITHFYRLPVTGGPLLQITNQKGGNEVTMSPDEKWLAIRYSYSNKPWELYIQENRPGAELTQVTYSTTEEFDAYAWREPEVISFKNRHGDDVYARLYQPENPKESRPAVIFVHGAGYLQNVHFWWSQYFREYMFHNLLVDLGYTVLDIDFTASSGYGRDHRTGIYRHMGGKDLSDQVDGAKLLIEKYGVNAKNIGIYGGSYGGFITLMALFNEPDVFAAGAALRSVTDWAHYNHGYTSNILNQPFDDPIAYRRSSPIYFAEGLQGHLLMCHGMLDVNVHFQDIVRVSQRLIELGKDNWELAVYPVEDHAFTTPSGWTDEYKRILKLFEERLTN